MSGLIGGSIGFGLSIILRLELALPGFILCSPLQYNSKNTIPSRDAFILTQTLSKIAFIRFKLCSH